MTLRSLLVRSLAKHRRLLIGLAVILSGFQFMLVVVAGNVEESRAFSQLTAFVPPMLQQAMGGMTFMSFRGLVSFGYSHPIVVLALVEAAIFLGSEPAWEVESGVLDLAMARPVRRSAMMTRSAFVVVIATAWLAMCMALMTLVALRLLAPAGAPWPPPGVTAILALNLGAVAVCFGCLALAVSAVASRRGTVLGITGLGAIGFYLLSLVAELWAPARRVVWISPFHYFNAMPIVAGGAAHWPRDVLVLASVSAVSSALAFVLYRHRDL